MLTSETTLDTPESIYDCLISMEETGAIDDVYDLVLERTDPKSSEVMCKMLAVLLAAYEPLTVDELEDILKHVGVRASAKALVQNLGSVLSVDQSTDLIQFRHPTLVEYLRRRSVTPAVDDRNKLYIDIANAHGQAASWCLKRLKSRTEGPKFNICQFESSFRLNRQIPDLAEKVSKFIPRRLRYACSHWSFHLGETNDKWRSTLTNELLHIIRCPYVLYWMEILSVTRGVLRAIAGLQLVARHAGVSSLSRNFLVF